MLWLRRVLLLGHALLRRSELHGRQRHVLCHVLRVEHEALLQLHALLLKVLLVLLVLSGVGMLHLLLLLLLSLLFLLRCSMSLRELLWGRFFLPSPFLFEFFVDKADPPASFLVNLLEDVYDFFLLLSICENFTCVCERSNGN